MNNKNLNYNTIIDPDNKIGKLLETLNDYENVQKKYQQVSNQNETSIAIRDFYDNFVDGKYSDLNKSLGKQEASIRYHSYKEIFRNGSIRLFYPLLVEINNAAGDIDYHLPINLDELLGINDPYSSKLNQIENSISYLLEFDFYLKARLTEISINDISLHAASILYNIFIAVVDNNMDTVSRINQIVEAYRTSLRVLIKVLNNHAHTVYKPMFGNMQK